MTSAGIDRPRRLVTLRQDGEDFIVLFYPEEIVVFRHHEPQQLRKMCAFLRWKIISDSSADRSSASDDGLGSAE
jgi:hypothetical protein